MNIFLVDDHPMIIDGFQNILEKNQILLPSNFVVAIDATSAFEKIKTALASKRFFDLAIIDYSIPPDIANNILFGSDIVLLLQKQMPNCKIIMVTAHTEKILVYNIAKKVNPDGLLIKNDITPENLLRAISVVLEGAAYRSPMVLKCLSDVGEKNLMMDDTNRQILTYMSKGFKVKDLETIVHISKSAIEKRIYKLKIAFNVADDSRLLQEVISKGFI